MSTTTYQKDQTGILQSATKAAAELTAAEVAAGIVKSHDTIVKRFNELRDDVVLPALKEAVDADNAMFKAEEASAAAKPAKSGGKRSNTPARSDGAPGDVVIGRPGGQGKFDGLTVAQVFALSSEEAGEYGYVDKQGNNKPGSEYINWMAGNDKNPFMQKIATAFLESKRAESDA